MASAVDAASCLSFPLDIFLIIIRDLDWKDILSLAQCSKELAFLTASRAVWHSVLQTCIIDEMIPIPPLHTSISALSSHDIKQTVRRALALRSAWTQANPQTTRRHDHTSPTNAMPSGVAFIPGHGNRYVALVTTSTEPITQVTEAPRHRLSCIDISCSPSRVAASCYYTHPVKFALNEASDAPGQLAVASAAEGVLTTQILALDPAWMGRQLNYTGTDPGGFLTLFQFPTNGVPMLFRDNVLASGDQEGNVWLYDTRDGKLLYHLRDPRAPHMNETVRVVLLQDIVLTFGFATIKLFTLPCPLSTSSPEPSESSTSETSQILDKGLPAVLNDTRAPQTCPVLLPTSEHRWRWRIDTISVSPLVHAHAEPTSRARLRPPINIFVRFGSWYPWPINMLHHYVLTPSAPPSAPSLPLPAAPVGSTAASTDPAVVLSSPFTTSHDAPASPYCLPPTLAMYTYSALDLFTVSDTALGPYGTALWTDSHCAPGASSEAAARSGWQRVAGKVLRPPAPQDAVPEVLEAAAERYDQGRTVVFGAFERPEAYQVAMDEEGGRVAIAWKRGGLSVWEYMPEEAEV